MKKIFKITPIISLNNSTYNIRIFNTHYFLKLANNHNKNLIKSLEHKNITPKNIFISNKILFNKYIDEATLDEKTQNTEEFLRSLSLELNKLHSLHSDNYFNPFEKIQNNFSYLKERNFPLPADINILLEKFETIQEELSKNIELGLCHNDLNPSNILYKNDKVFLVDFDFIGINDIYYDLAMLSWFLSKNMRKKLLFFYFGECSTSHLNKLDKYIFIAKLWNASWSYIKSIDSSSCYDYKLGGDMIIEDLLK